MLYVISSKEADRLRSLNYGLKKFSTLVSDDDVDVEKIPPESVETRFAWPACRVHARVFRYIDERNDEENKIKAALISLASRHTGQWTWPHRRMYGQKTDSEQFLQLMDLIGVKLDKEPDDAGGRVQQKKKRNS